MEEVTLQNFFFNISETCKGIFLSAPDKLLQEEKLLWSTLQLYTLNGSDDPKILGHERHVPTTW